MRGGNGKIICEGDTRGKAVEILVAKILWMVVGGEIRILRERDEYKTKTPDMMRDNSEIIEIKRVSSETSVDNRVRDGIRQLCQEEFREFQKV